MELNHLNEKFERMGARVSFERAPRFPFGVQAPAVRLDIRRDARGEYFQVLTNPEQLDSIEVLDVRPSQRHLLLMVRQRPQAADGVLKQKFLCGHDERAWFVAAIPESSHAATVSTAIEALKPPVVHQALDRARVKRRDRNRRRNRAFVRQGEWFFIPQPDLRVDSKLVLRNEPMRRGAGKPHWAELAFRTGGRPVHVSHVAPNGYSPEEYRHWLDQNPKERGRVRWTLMRRDARLYVRGRVRHPDHKTITLQHWHLVEQNTETQAQAMKHVAFLD